MAKEQVCIVCEHKHMLASSENWRWGEQGLVGEREWGSRVGGWGPGSPHLHSNGHASCLGGPDEHLVVIDLEAVVVRPNDDVLQAGVRVPYVGADARGEVVPAGPLPALAGGQTARIFVHTQISTHIR